MSHKKNKWTIVFLVYADLRDAMINLKELSKQLKHKENENDKIVRELKNLYKDIVTSPFNDHVDIVVIYNRIILKQSQQKHDVTYLLQAVPNKKTSKFKKRLKLIERWNTNQIMHQKDKLIEVFKCISSKFNAQRFMLFTWDHGSIFGIFRESDKLENLSLSQSIKIEKVSEDEEGVTWVKRNHSFNRFWDNEWTSNGYNMPPCHFIRNHEPESREILTNEELQYVINKWLPNKKLDVLIMMNCYMQNVNTAYALRNCVKYLVAPEGIINEPGYNYSAIFKSIFCNPQLLSRQVAKKTVSSLKEFYNNPVFKASVNQWAIFAIHLKKYHYVVNLINDLAVLQLDKMNLDKDFRNKIHDEIRIHCFPFDIGVSLCMIDLKNYVVKLNKNLSVQGLDDIEFKLRKLIKEITVKKLIGKNVYNYQRVRRPDNYKPCGIAIYFPANKSDILKKTFHTFIAEDATSRSTFFSHTEWLKFICQYLSP